MFNLFTCRQPLEKVGNLYLSHMTYVDNDNITTDVLRFGVTTEMNRWKKQSYAENQLRWFLHRMFIVEKQHDIDRNWKIIEPFLGLGSFALPYNESKTEYEKCITSLFFEQVSKFIEVRTKVDNKEVSYTSIETREAKKGSTGFLIGSYGKKYYSNRMKEMELILSRHNINTVQDLLTQAHKHKNDSWDWF